MQIATDVHISAQGDLALRLQRDHGGRGYAQHVHGAVVFDGYAIFEYHARHVFPLAGLFVGVAVGGREHNACAGVAAWAQDDDLLAHFRRPP